MQIGYARPPALVVPSSGVLLSLGLSATPRAFTDVFKALRQRWAPLNAAAAGAVEKGPAWRGKESSEANQCSDDASDEPAGPLKGVQDSESRTLQAPLGREGRLLGEPREPSLAGREVSLRSAERFRPGLTTEPLAQSRQGSLTKGGQTD